MFDVWAEGYALTGDWSPAMRLGTFEAETFDEAVEACMRSLPTHKAKLFAHEDGQWTYWGCRLFSDEHAARVAFG